MLIARILVAVGFFSIKTTITQLPIATLPPAPTVLVSVEKKYCRYCGTENKAMLSFVRSVERK